jgi:putative transposase
MGQIARVVVPSYPHLITQGGNRGQQTFFCVEDYRAYVDMISEFLEEEKTGPNRKGEVSQA